MLQKFLQTLSRDLNSANIPAFSKNLGMLVRLIGMSAVADAADVTRLTLHLFTQGSREVRIGTLCRILNALDLEIVLKAKPKLRREMRALAKHHRLAEEDSQSPETVSGNERDNQ